MAYIQFQGTFQRFFTGRGTGTASLESNLLQQILGMREEVLYEIFLYLYKAYGTLYRQRYIEILEAYGVGPIPFVPPGATSTDSPWLHGPRYTS